jgi:hypothetical protein
VGSLSITPERLKVIDFSTPYAVISLIIGAPKSMAIKDYADLNGKRIGVTRATPNDTLTTQNAKGAEIMRYEDDATLITSMVTVREVFSSTPSNLQEMQKKAPQEPGNEVRTEGPGHCHQQEPAAPEGMDRQLGQDQPEEWQAQCHLQEASRPRPAGRRAESRLSRL